MASESQLVRAMARHLEAKGAWVVKTHGSTFGRRGVPDLLVCIEGRFVAIEAKVGRNKPTLLQEREIGKIRDAGGVAGVAYSIAEVERLVMRKMDDE